MSGFDWNTWGPPLGVLLAGLVVGLVVAFRSRGDSASRRAADAQQGQREALNARKNSLVEQVRALDSDVDKLGREAFLAQRSALVQDAAAALRAIDALGEAPAAPAPSSSEAAGDRRALRAGLWLSLVVVFFGILGVYLSESTKTRGSGDSITGNTSATTAEQESAEVAAAREVLALNPEDLGAINTITYAALTSRKLDEAMAMIDQARAIDESNPDVQLHLAILQLSVGMFDKAEIALNQAIAAEPERGRFHLWMGLLRMYQSQPQVAVTSIEKALALGIRVDEQGFARQLLSEARNPRPAATAAAPSGITYSGPGGGSAMVSGTVGLVEGTAEAPGATVFVVVYGSPAKGRPVATMRLPAGDLPASFQFEEGHAMGGAPWPDAVWITAKIDADGSAGSGDGDVTIELTGPLGKGAEGASLLLPGRGAPAAAPTPAPEQSGAVQLSGQLVLAETAQAAPDQVVFLIVYGNPAGTGRPVAARRLLVSDLPVDFSLTAADTMGGAPWPAEVWVRAKIDADGSAGSSDGDQVGPLGGPFAAGAQGVAVQAGGS